MVLAVPCAWAAPNFEPTSGTGWVPGRDVQTLLGWSDVQFQERAPAVNFNYRLIGQYSAVCAWTNVQGVRVDERRSVSVSWQAHVTSSLRRDARDARRTEAFLLMGFGGSPQQGGSAPVEGAPCAGSGGSMGTWRAVVPHTGSNSLSANFSGVDVLLPF